MKTTTGRDIRFFLLGVLAMFVFVMIYDWEDAKRGFMDGYNGSEYNYEQKQQTETADQAKEE